MTDERETRADLHREADHNPDPDHPPTPSCAMCEEHPPKYTCPGCGRKTCSLACVNRHKETFACTGKRDRTGFVKRGELSYDTLKSDYKFLEEMQRLEDVSKRTQPPAPRRQVPKPLKTLVQQAKNREVSLQLISPGMKRRKENTTRYDFKSKVIHWRVEWVFSDGKVATTDRMSEETEIRDQLEKVIQQLYANGMEESVTVRMRQEGVRADQAVDYDVDVGMTLGAFLRGKHVVEFPTFRVDAGR